MRTEHKDPYLSRTRRPPIYDQLDDNAVWMGRYSLNNLNRVVEANSIDRADVLTEEKDADLTPCMNYRPAGVL